MQQNKMTVGTIYEFNNLGILTQSIYSKCAKYLAHLTHQTQKIPPIRCSICAKFLPFVSGESIPYRTDKQTGTVNPPISYRKKYQPYRSISGNTGQYAQEKKFFFYYYYFLSFVIFEFLLGQNSNLFALIYQYYLFSQYAMVTFKLFIFYVVFFFFLLIDTKV